MSLIDSPAEADLTAWFNGHGLDKKAVRLFQKIVYAYYRVNRRPMPWRETDDPYQILISEIMLQQTQVGRVAEKYQEFIAAFPDIQSLANADFRKLLSVWQGLGYNRRALLLQECAIRIVEEHNGALPVSEETLRSLPGIGRYTAGALMAFVFGEPVVFIETNIRAVFIHHFFHDRDDVTDAEIIPLIERTVDRKAPREWYYALMDYGTHIKRSFRNPSRSSAHHVKQRPFEGSTRQLRGMLLRSLVAEPASAYTVSRKLGVPRNKAKELLSVLEKEGFITKNDDIYRIRK